jgi:hypothetical protein
MRWSEVSQNLSARSQATTYSELLKILGSSSFDLIEGRAVPNSQLLPLLKAKTCVYDPKATKVYRKNTVLDPAPKIKEQFRGESHLSPRNPNRQHHRTS